MLRPLPNLDDAAAMARLGRLSALRSARLDALHDLRDACTRIQSGAGSAQEHDIADARACLDRIERINELEHI